MHRLSEFFRDEGAGGLGVFYPTNYIVAVYPTSAEAVRVRNELDTATPASIAVTGDEMVEFATDQAAKVGLWGALMREVSRMIGTEEQYSEQDLREAHKGAAFVAAYCVDEQAKANLWDVLKGASPLAARYYGAGGIEHLAGDP